MTAFNTTMYSLFSDLNLAETAIYQSVKGESKSVEVIMYEPDVSTRIGDSFVSSPTAVLNVLVEDCPEIVAGDKFIVAGRNFVVQGTPRHDSHHLTWYVDLYEA